MALCMTGMMALIRRHSETPPTIGTRVGKRESSCSQTLFMNFHRKTITGIAARHHLPAMYGFQEYVDDGGLLSYGANLKDQFRRAGGYVAKILKGAKLEQAEAELKELA